MFSRCSIALVLAASFMSSVSYAQDEDLGGDEAVDGKKVVYQKETDINFEGLDVQGEIKKPTGAYLLERKKSNFSPLIKFKQNWDEEVVRSMEQTRTTP